MVVEAVELEVIVMVVEEPPPPSVNTLKTELGEFKETLRLQTQNISTLVVT